MLVVVVLTLAHRRSQTRDHEKGGQYILVTGWCWVCVELLRVVISWSQVCTILLATLFFSEK